MKGGFRPICKDCRKADRLANLETYKAQERASHDRNRDSRNEYNRARYSDPAFREEMQRRNREWHAANKRRKLEGNRRWREANPDKVRAQNRAAYARGSLRHTVSSHVLYCLKRVGSTKAHRRLEELLGYSHATLRAHIERQFVGKMDWSNHGTVWELDHIVPLVAFDISSPDDPAFRDAWALTNLRPLEKRKNRQKSGKRTHLL